MTAVRNAFEVEMLILFPLMILTVTAIAFVLFREIYRGGDKR